MTPEDLQAVREVLQHEFRVLQLRSPGLGSPARSAGDLSQKVLLNKGAGAPDSALLSRPVFKTQDRGFSANKFGTIILEAQQLETDPLGPTSQGWSRLRAQLAWGIGGNIQTLFCDWSNQMVQVPLENLEITALWGPAPFCGSASNDPPLLNDVTNESGTWQLSAAVCEDIRPQAMNTTFTYAYGQANQAFDVPPYAYAWHVFKLDPLAPFGVNSVVRFTRNGTTVAAYNYPYNPSSMEQQLPGALMTHAYQQTRGLGDAQIVIENTDGGDFMLWFDIRV